MKAPILFILAALVVGSLSSLIYTPAPLFIAHATPRDSKRASKQTPITSCPVSHCASAGELCGNQKDANGFATSTTNCFAYNLTCSLTSSTAEGDYGSCTPLASFGMPCAVSAGGISNCSTNLQCLDGVCANDYSFEAKYPGEVCGATDVCHFQVNSTTDVHLCSNGVCLYTADGQPCTSANQCNRNSSYCDNAATAKSPSTCKPYAPVGTFCALDAYHGECQFDCVPTALSGTVGKCGGAYSLGTGQPCAQDIDCNYGLFCGPPAVNNTYGVCTASAKTKTLHKPCEYDSNCTLSNNEYCGCNSAFSTSGAVCLSRTYPANFYSNNAAMLSCYINSKCDLSDVNCLRSHCQNQMCDFYTNLPDSQDLGMNCVLTNALMPYCTSSTPAPSSTPTPTPSPTPSSTTSVADPSSTTSDPTTSSASSLVLSPLAIFAVFIALLRL